MPKLAGVNHLRAIKAFKKAGFRVAREGKHTIMTDGVRIIVIPPVRRLVRYLWSARSDPFYQTSLCLPDRSQAL